MLNVDLKDISKAFYVKKIEDFLVTIYIEKAFDFLDHNFLITALEKYGFGRNFISWVKILLKNQESCVLKGGTTTKYFLLGRSTYQGHPISTYLSILTLQIKGLAVFNHCYLYSAYAYDTTSYEILSPLNIWLLLFIFFRTFLN